MSEPHYDGSAVFPNAFRSVFQQPLSLKTETSLFILASVLDATISYFLFTYAVVTESSHTGFTESNPVALFFLVRWGHYGVVYFKFSMVAVVCVIAQIIAFQKMETARKLMIFAATTVFLVVIYSLALFQYSKFLPYEV